MIERIHLTRLAELWAGGNLPIDLQPDQHRILVERTDWVSEPDQSRQD